jgi:hypothetical protein
MLIRSCTAERYATKLAPPFDVVSERRCCGNVVRGADGSDHADSIPSLNLAGTFVRYSSSIIIVAPKETTKETSQRLPADVVVVVAAAAAVVH